MQQVSLVPFLLLCFCCIQLCKNLHADKRLSPLPYLVTVYFQSLPIMHGMQDVPYVQATNCYYCSCLSKEP